MFFLLVLASCTSFKFNNLGKGLVESLEACMVSKNIVAFKSKLQSQPREFFVREGESLLKFAFAEEERGTDLRPFIEKLLFNFANPFIKAPEKYTELLEFSRKRVLVLESFNRESSILNEEEFTRLMREKYGDLSMLESVVADFDCNQVVELATKFKLLDRDVLVKNKNFYTLLAEGKRLDVLELIITAQDQSKLWEKQEGLDTALYIFAKAGLLPGVIKIFINKGIDRKELLIAMEGIEKLHQYVNEEVAQPLIEDLSFCFNYSLASLCRYISRSARDREKFIAISELFSLGESPELNEEQFRTLKFLFQNLFNLQGEEPFLLELLSKRVGREYALELLFRDVWQEIRSRMLQYENNFFRAAFSRLEDIERLSSLLVLLKEAGFNISEQICRKSSEGKDILTEVIQSQKAPEKLKLLLREELDFDRLAELLVELKGVEGMDMIRLLIRSKLSPGNLNDKNERRT